MVEIQTLLFWLGDHGTRRPPIVPLETIRRKPARIKNNFPEQGPKIPKVLIYLQEILLKPETSSLQTYDGIYCTNIDNKIICFSGISYTLVDHVNYFEC